MPSKSSQKAKRKPAESKEESRSQRRGHRERNFPGRNSTMSFVTSAAKTGSYHLISGSYTQTFVTHNSEQSQYQADSILGLPSATSWPNDATVPCQTRLDHDLLGLDRHLLADGRPAHTITSHSKQSVECLYHRTALQADFAGGNSARGLGGIDRFVNEVPSECGTVYFHEDGFHQTNACSCFEAWRTGAFSWVRLDDEESVVS